MSKMSNEQPISYRLCKISRTTGERSGLHNGNKAIEKFRKAAR